MLDDSTRWILTIAATLKLRPSNQQRSSLLSQPKRRLRRALTISFVRILMRRRRGYRDDIKQDRGSGQIIPTRSLKRPREGPVPAASLDGGQTPAGPAI